MDHIPRLLVDLTLGLATAAITTLVARRLKLPVIFGYLLAGLVVGPYVIKPLALTLDLPILANLATLFSADEENVKVMAELGVILIMFGIGLEFSLKKLMRAGLTALLIATMQAGAVMISGIALGSLLGWNSMEGIFMGAAMIATSTVVIVKLFEDTSPSAELRETVFSVTIVHDLFAILLMTILMTLTKVGVSGIKATELIWTIAKFCIFLFGVVIVGRFFIPQFFRKLADEEKPENLAIASIGFCFAMAFLAVACGFSLAIGAFAAGMLAAESEREHQIEKQVTPIRDVFTALFFVAAGMQLVPSVIAANIGTILLFVMLVILVNGIAVTSGGLLSGLSFRTSLQTSAALGQFGEFAFVIMTIGIAAGVVRPELFSITVSVAVITALTSMFLFKASSPLADSIDRHLPDSLRAQLGMYQAWLSSLRNRGLKKGEGATLLKPLVLLLLDCLVLVGLAYSYNKTLYLADLIQDMGTLRDVVAHASLTIILGIGTAIMVLSIIKHGRILARLLASLAPNPETSGTGRTGRHLLAGGLRIAIMVLVGLFITGVLLAFVPAGPLLLVSVAVFVFVLARQILAAHKLTQVSSMGTEWLLSRLFGKEQDGRHPEVDRTGTYRILRICDECPYLGQNLSRAKIEEVTGATVMALLRDGHITVPLHPEPVIQLDDRLVMTGSEMALNDAVKLLCAKGAKSIQMTLNKDHIQQ